jgi:hypothetical protein
MLARCRAEQSLFPKLDFDSGAQPLFRERLYKRVGHLGYPVINSVGSWGRSFRIRAARSCAFRPGSRMSVQSRSILPCHVSLISMASAASLAARTVYPSNRRRLLVAYRQTASSSTNRMVVTLTRVVRRRVQERWVSRSSPDLGLSKDGRCNPYDHRRRSASAQ